MTNLIMRILQYMFCFLFCANGFCEDVHSVANNEPIVQYVDKYKEIAISEMHRSGIPASIKLAQGILESNSGRSTLAIKANNHFGIKCGKYWDGSTFYRKDDDYRNGQLIESCFRKFKDALQSFIAHSDFLLNPGSKYRYGFLFGLDPLDYQSWAKGLKKSGYATDATYAEKLISIIEKYQLFRFDNGGLPFQFDEEIVSDNSTGDKNDTENIRKQNDAGSEINESRRSSFEVRDEFHIVKNGETMQAIADRYNIDINLFYFQNRIPDGSEPRPGQKLKINGYFHWGKKPKIYNSKSINSSLEFLFDQDNMRISIQ